MLPDRCATYRPRISPNRLTNWLNRRVTIDAATPGQRLSYLRYVRVSPQHAAWPDSVEVSR